jgi:hypothetical protein
MMNFALMKLLPVIETRPNDDQEAVAEAAREIEALRTGVYAMSADEDVAVVEGLLQAERNEFADDDRIRALWKRAGL